MCIYIINIHILLFIFKPPFLFTSACNWCTTGCLICLLVTSSTCPVQTRQAGDWCSILVCTNSNWLGQVRKSAENYSPFDNMFDKGRAVMSAQAEDALIRCQWDWLIHVHTYRGCGVCGRRRKQCVTVRGVTHSLLPHERRLTSLNVWTSPDG